MDLINFLRVLDRRKWLMLAIISVAVITTFLIVRQTPPAYRASGQLATGLVGSADLFIRADESRRPEKYETESKIKSIVEQIQSPQVLTLLSYRLMLHDLDPNRTEGFRSVIDLRTQYTVAELEAARRTYLRNLDSLEMLNPEDRNQAKYLEMIEQMDYHPAALQRGLLVRRIPGTDLIDVEYIGEKPGLTAFVVNTLLREYTRYHRQLQQQRSAEAVASVETLVADKRRALNQLLQQVPSPDRKQELSQEAQALLARIDRLETARMEAVERRNDALIRYQTFHDRISGNPPAPYLQLEQEEAGSQAMPLLDEAQTLMGRYVRNDLAPPALRDSLTLVADSLRRRLSAFTQQQLPQSALVEEALVRGQIQAEVDRAMAELVLQKLYQQLRGLGRQLAKLDLISSDTEVLQSLEIARDEYLSALGRLYEARLGLGQQAIARLSPVAFVQPPDQPEPSQVWFLSTLAGIISLAIGVLVVFVMEYLDSSIKYPSRVQTITGLPLIGTLNLLQARNLDLVSLFSDTSKNQSLENFKQLMRKLRFQLGESSAQTFLVTSTTGESGKTSLLVSLAYALSLSGKQVLMIDANFKNNTLTRIIGAHPSLEKFLNQEIPRRDLISNSIFDGVDVIGCEGGNFSPAEVFKDEPFHALMASLKKEYDYLLLEGSPLNAFSDSRELADYVEKVIVVFAANQPIAALDLESVQYLQSLGSKCMGAVLNRVPLSNLRL